MAKSQGFFFLLAIIGATLGFHTGAPGEQACGSMTPGHGPQPQTGSSPYRIIMSNTKTSGEPININLVASTSGPKFRGFFIQVRAVGGNEPVGQFNPNSDPSLAQPVSCNGKDNVAMTHKDNNDKEQVKLQWTPPSGDGQYDVFVTFVKQMDTFWVKQMADSKIEVSSAATIPTGGRSGAGGQQQSQFNNNNAAGSSPSTGNASTGNETNSSSSQEPPSEGGAATNIISLCGAISLSVLCSMISFFHYSHSSLF